MNDAEMGLFVNELLDSRNKREEIGAEVFTRAGFKLPQGAYTVTPVADLLDKMTKKGDEDE